MKRILGIDPGSRITGYGVIDTDGRTFTYVASGCIKISATDIPSRLKTIFESVQEIVTAYSPEEMAIERVFMHRNADSALKLGQARGAAITAVVTKDISVSEYSPNEIKQAVVGRGHADKAQVQHMVKILFNLNAMPQVDASDALAIAYCHGAVQNTVTNIKTAQRVRGGRYIS